MGHTQVGSCPRCGSPIYAPTFYWSILPPPTTKTCSCFPEPRTIITNTTNQTG